MRHELLEAHFGRPVAIDLCLTCHVFWFDGRESLQLSPASTLKLFKIIGDHTAATRPEPADQLACPRCRARLRLTRDMQRSTRFEYWSCPNSDGRLTTFFNFPREKNFVKPLSAGQIAELRQHLQAVNCSNCGAPVDLTKSSSCAHCGSPLSMLDMHQAERLIDELKAADRTGKPVDPTLPFHLAHIRHETNQRFDFFEKDSAWFDRAKTSGLLAAGLGTVARWLRGE